MSLGFSREKRREREEGKGGREKGQGLREI